MRCQQCGADNPDSNRFCGQCGGEVVVAQADGDQSADACWKCGEDNVEEARFCEACGAGLIETCPKCQVESRVRMKYCVACGVAKSSYSEADEALASARIHLENLRYEPAVSDCDRGLKTGYLKEQFEKTRRHAMKLIKQFCDLQADAERLVNEEEFEKARDVLKDAMQLAPQDEELEARYTQLANRVRDEQVGLALGKAEAALKEGNQFREALEASRRVLGLDPKNARAIELKRQARQLDNDHHQRLNHAKELLSDAKLDKGIRMIRELMADFPWDQTLNQPLQVWEDRRAKVNKHVGAAREALTENNFQRATTEMSRISRLVPSHPDIKAIEKMCAKLSEEYDQLLDDAQLAMNAHRYQDAIRQFEELTTNFPWDPGVRDKLEECRDYAGQIDTRRKQAMELMHKKDWKGARRVWRSLLASLPNDEEATEGLANATRRIRRDIRARIVAVPVMICLAIGIWLASMNHYRIDQTQKHLQSGNIMLAEESFGKIIPFGVWQMTELKIQMEEARAGQKAMSSKALSDASAAKLPTTDSTIMNALSLYEANESAAKGEAAADVRFWAAADLHWKRAREMYDSAKKKADRLVETRKSAIGARENAQTVRKLARSAAQPEDPDGLWTEPDGLVAEAEQRFEKGLFHHADQLWLQAAEIYQTRHELFTLRKQVATARVAAAGVNAETKAVDYWTRAEESAGEAVKKLAQAAADEAHKSWETALAHYEKARVHSTRTFRRPVKEKN